jgi:hypothetical protein
MTLAVTFQHEIYLICRCHHQPGLLTHGPRICLLLVCLSQLGQFVRRSSCLQVSDELITLLSSQNMSDVMAPLVIGLRPACDRRKAKMPGNRLDDFAMMPYNLH